MRTSLGNLFPVLLLAAGLWGGPASAGEFRLGGWLDGARGAPALRALARHLSVVTGHDITAAASANALSHWVGVRLGRGDLVLEPAHFLAYRVRRHRFTVIAKLRGDGGFSLVTAPGTLVVDPDLMVGMVVAAPPAPSLPALYLERLFPDAIRGPRLHPVGRYADGVRLLLEGVVEAAVIPTRDLVGRSRLNVVVETEPVAAPGFAVAPSVPEPVRRSLRAALLERPPGAALLFEPATDRLYEGLDRLLRGTWGY